MREKDSEFINCRALIFVAVAFFCTIVGVAKTTNDGVSGKVLYANDSLYVEVSNNSNDTVYVFDTYLKEDVGHCLANSKYLHRYNYNTDRFVISLLPLKPYLSAGLSDLIRFGENLLLIPGVFGIVLPLFHHLRRKRFQFHALYYRLAIILKILILIRYLPGSPTWTLSTSGIFIRRH